MFKDATYDFEEFKRACSQKNVTNVVCIGDVLDDADKQFNLDDKTKVFQFIANDGLEDLRFINRKELEKSPFQQKVDVDAYHFRTGGILGYIAFYKSPITNKWIIKSFHQSDQRSRIMEEAFLRSGILNGLKKGRK